MVLFYPLFNVILPAAWWYLPSMCRVPYASECWPKNQRTHRTHHLPDSGFSLLPATKLTCLNDHERGKQPPLLSDFHSNPWQTGDLLKGLQPRICSLPESGVSQNFTLTNLPTQWPWSCQSEAGIVSACPVPRHPDVCMLNPESSLTCLQASTSCRRWWWRQVYPWGKNLAATPGGDL